MKQGVRVREMRATDDGDRGACPSHTHVPVTYGEFVDDLGGATTSSRCATAWAWLGRRIIASWLPTSRHLHRRRAVIVSLWVKRVYMPSGCNCLLRGSMVMSLS